MNSKQPVELSSDEDDRKVKTFQLFAIIRKKETEDLMITRLMKLLQSGVDINTQNPKGKTVSHIAAEKNLAKVLKFLIKNGAKTSIMNDDNKTVLDIAKHRNQEDIMQALEEKEREACQSSLDDVGHDLSEIVINCSKLNKRMVCEGISNELATSLSSKNMSVFEIMKQNDNAFLLDAAKKGRVKDVSFLLDYGANVNCSNEKNKRPIDLAWNNRYYDTVLVLLEADSKFPKGFDIDSIMGNTGRRLKSFVSDRYALHKNIKHGEFLEVKEYVQNNISRFYLSTNGFSALRQAIKTENYKIYAFLRSEGIVFKNEDEETKYTKQLRNMENKEQYMKEIEEFYVSCNDSHDSNLIANSRSFGHVKDFENRIEKYYRKLDEIPEISIILKVIQHCQSLCVNFNFYDTDVSTINPTQKFGTVGCTNIKTGEIHLGAMINSENGERKILGTLAHEFTHLAMQLIYKNDSNPCIANEEFEFEAIVESIKCTYFSNTYTLDENITRVFRNYKPKDWPSELIVRIPQLYAVYGKSKGERLILNQVPNLLDYYKNTVIPKCKEFVEYSSDLYASAA